MQITENTGEVGVDHERSICRGMHLVWEDLTVVVPNFGNGHTRRLLDGLSGYAEPGRIMAIMGPSGSGKSTLLDSLAGSLSLSHGFFFLNLQDFDLVSLNRKNETCLQVMILFDMCHGLIIK